MFCMKRIINQRHYLSDLHAFFSVPRPPDMHIVLINATTVNVTWHRPSDSVPLVGYLLSVGKVGSDKHTQDLDLPANRKYQLLTNLGRSEVIVILSFQTKQKLLL